MRRAIADDRFGAADRQRQIADGERATPNTISTTFDRSPSPNTMNRIGSTAIGGIIESTATSVPNVAPKRGNSPTAMPKQRPINVATPNPMPSRLRLAPVSSHRMISPVRRSFEYAMCHCRHLGDGRQQLVA
jgi:hypothetical protein